MTTTKKAVVFSDGKIKRFEKIVKQQTEEKKAQLNRALDNKVDEVFDKKYQQFLKEFKVKKELETLKKASDELEAFERTLEDKKRTLKDAVKLHAKKVRVICERQAKINGHNTDFGYYDNDYSDFNSMEDLINYVKLVDTDESLYNEYLNQPLFKNKEIKNEFYPESVLDFFESKILV